MSSQKPLLQPLSLFKESDWQYHLSGHATRACSRAYHKPAAFRTSRRVQVCGQRGERKSGEQCVCNMSGHGRVSTKVLMSPSRGHHCLRCVCATLRFEKPDSEKSYQGVWYGLCYICTVCDSDSGLKCFAGIWLLFSLFFPLRCGGQPS